jgi:hypothetical protein
VVDTGEGLWVDTDGDGIVDEVETGTTCVGSSTGCPDPADSDGDGYTDLFEERNRISGFDPLDAKKPLVACSSKSDVDNDLLRDCEEDFLKTDWRLPDTDGDRIPDGVELRTGMDPLAREDSYADPDRDGERNIDEVKAHTNPMVAASPSHPVMRYLYDVVPFTKDTGEQCFELDVRHIKLRTTGKATSSRLGLNRVLLYFDEAPLNRALDYGRVRIACADVRYVDGVVKSPPNGQVSFAHEDFVPAELFDPRNPLHCPDLTTIQSSTPDAGAGGP